MTARVAPADVSMANLWVHVSRATVDQTDSSVLALLKVGSLTRKTRKAHTPNPQWIHEDFQFPVKDMGGSLTVELHRSKAFGQELMGLATIPLYTVRHSNKRGEGHWSCLFIPSPAGSLLPTEHQILLDTHFELPKDIPNDLAEFLESKLQKLDSVLEKEIEVIEDQHHRLVTGDLAPPRFPASGIYSYHSSTSSSASSSPIPSTPPFITVTGPSTPMKEMPLEDDRRSQSSQGSHDSHTPTPQGSPLHRAHKNSSPVRQSSPNRRSQSPHRNSFPNGQSSPVESPTHKPSRYSLTTSPIRSRGQSPLDDMENLGQQAHIARNRWKAAIGSPRFQKLVEVKRQEIPEGQRKPLMGSGTLARLVDQLTGLSQTKTLGNGNVKTYHSISREFMTRSKSCIVSKQRRMKERHGMDEHLRMHVYKRTMEALIYPASDPDAHSFEKWTAHKPTVCSECHALLWGLSKQGVKCTKCGKICHERCASLASQECFLVHDSHHTALDAYLLAISAKMHRTVVNHSSMFRLLRDAFTVDEDKHEVILEEIKTKILDQAQNFTAQICVKVLAAQGLNISASDRKVFVSVAIGNQRKRTKTCAGKRDLFWDEVFTFSCYNYHEPIRIRVWHERDSPLAMVANRLTKEGDTFLGEKVIEVRRVGPPRDVWYKLQKRAQTGQVSGSINLNLSVQVEGDHILAPFHDQYLYLHEQMFSYAYLVLNLPLVEISPKPEEDDEHCVNVKMLPKVAQEIVDEFALRYAIEPDYRMMVHMKLLVNHHSLCGALPVMGNLLKRLKHQMFMHVAADNAIRAVGAAKLMEEHFDSSNFGRDSFARLLDRLLTALRLDLQQYRELYPGNAPDKLEELVETCQLMATVLEFQQQAMGIVSAGKLEDLMLDSMKECLKTTFEFVAQNCVPQAEGEGQGDYGGHPGLSKAGKPFQFFDDLMRQIQAVVYEDRTVYAPLISRFCSFNLGDVSAVELWRMFENTIGNLFQVEANLGVFLPNDYIQLVFAVKGFHDSIVAKVPSRIGVVPEYPSYFLLCVRLWLQQEYQKKAIEFVKKAWEDDKGTFEFARHENKPFTSSTFQMFVYLLQGYEQVIKRLETQNVVVKYVHLEDFAQTICGVVQHYVDQVSMHLPECINELDKACMLLNNLQALRVNVQIIFEEMGGSEEKVGPGCLQVLHDFQMNVLAKELSSWCLFVARSLRPDILQAVGALQNELLKLKGQGAVEKNEVKVIVGPLLDMLATKAFVIATTCDQQVLPRVIKELWYIVLESLHRMLLPMLNREQTGSQAASIEFPTYNYSSRQCNALERSLSLMKAFFMEGEKAAAIKESTLDRGIKQLKGMIGLYRQTTEMLIADFIADAATSPGNVTASCGEVSINVDVHKHPVTGELEGTITVVSANNLRLLQGGTKPYIELNLVLPQSSSSKMRFTTHHKNTTTSPEFNQTFKFILSTWECCELQVAARSRSRFGLGADKVLGVAVVPLATVLKGDRKLTIGLEDTLPLTQTGQALLNVLSVRITDEIAKEFVALKTQKREVESHKSQD